MSFSQQSTAWQPGLLHVLITLCAHMDAYSHFQLCTCLLDKTSERGPLCPAGLAQPSGHPAHPRAVALHLPLCHSSPSVLLLSATSENFSHSPFLAGLPSQAVAGAYLHRANPACATWAGISSPTHSCPHQGFTDGAFIKQKHGTESQRLGSEAAAQLSGVLKTTLGPLCWVN